MSYSVFTCEVNGKPMRCPFFCPNDYEHANVHEQIKQYLEKDGRILTSWAEIEVENEEFIPSDNIYYDESAFICELMEL